MDSLMFFVSSMYCFSFGKMVYYFYKMSKYGL